MVSPPTTLSTDSRSQTPQDYVIGIVVFIAVVVVVVGFLPMITAPYQSGVGGDDIAQSDRVAQQLVSNLSTPGEPNQLNRTQLEQVLALDSAQLSSRYGLAERTKVNITVMTLNGSDFVQTDGGKTLTSTTSYDRGSVASAARIVRLSTETHNCEPACRLVVRVW
ncbi:MAG: hypothetical protein V5A45_03240 [Haloarculaceae archaeon]